MRTRKTKEQFIEDMKKRINLREQLNIFYNDIYLPTLKKFDGKVYNIRFIKALREQAEKLNNLIYVKELEHTNTIEIQLRHNQYSYTDYESLWAKLVLTNEGRISYELTINDEIGKKWIENFNEYKNEYQMAIDNYDQYMTIAEQLEKALQTYNKLPHSFRNNLDTQWMHIY